MLPGGSRDGIGGCLALGLSMRQPFSRSFNIPAVVGEHGDKSRCLGRLILPVAVTVVASLVALTVHRTDVAAQSTGPVITAVSGTIAQGNTLQIAGSGFGTKSAAAPLKWDNFEGGSNSAPLTGWFLDANDGVNVPTYSNLVTRGNSKMSARANFINGNTSSDFGITSTPLPVIYLDAWYYFDAVAPYARNEKVFRVMPGAPGPGDLYWGFFCETYPHDSIVGADAGSTGNDSDWLKIGPDDLSRTWSHLQVYLVQSSVGVADGSAVIWVNGVKQLDESGNFLTRATSTSWNEILLGNYFAHGGSGTDCPNDYGDAYAYWDDVYLDTTLAHVEIGDAATYASVRHREIQLPTAWADGSITFKLNQGSFTSFSNLYVYVTDSQGRVNATGMPLVGGSDVTPPTVSSTQPAAGAVNVATTSPIRVTFSEPMNVSTVNTSTFVLRDSHGNLVTSTVSYDGTTNIATLQPGAALAASSPYTVTVKSGSTGVKDVAGNALVSDYVWSFTTAAVSQSILNGLVAAYSFNEGSGTTVADSSGQNNNGTVTSATWAPGRFGTGLTFNGSSSWVAIPDAPSLNPAAAVTMEAWVNPTDLTAWRTIVLKEIPGGLDYALYANDNAPKPAAYFHRTGQSLADGIGGVDPLPLNTWTHVATTYDGTTAWLYVNGTPVASMALAGSLLQSSGVLRIGGNAVWGEYFAGMIDEVRVYNRALSAAEIATDMNTPVPSSAGSRPPAPPTNLRIVK